MNTSTTLLFHKVTRKVSITDANLDISWCYPKAVKSRFTLAAFAGLFPAIRNNYSLGKKPTVFVTRFALPRNNHCGFAKLQLTYHMYQYFPVFLPLSF